MALGWPGIKKGRGALHPRVKLSPENHRDGWGRTGEAGAGWSLRQGPWLWPARSSADSGLLRTRGQSVPSLASRAPGQVALPTWPGSWTLSNS